MYKYVGKSLAGGINVKTFLNDRINKTIHRPNNADDMVLSA